MIDIHREVGAIRHDVRTGLEIMGKMNSIKFSVAQRAMQNYWNRLFSNEDSVPRSFLSAGLAAIAYADAPDQGLVRTRHLEPWRGFWEYVEFAILPDGEKLTTVVDTKIPVGSSESRFRALRAGERLARAYYAAYMDGFDVINESTNRSCIYVK